MRRTHRFGPHVLLFLYKQLRLLFTLWKDTASATHSVTFDPLSSDTHAPPRRRPGPLTPGAFTGCSLGKGGGADTGLLPPWRITSETPPEEFNLQH